VKNVLTDLHSLGIIYAPYQSASTYVTKTSVRSILKNNSIKKSTIIVTRFAANTLTKRNPRVHKICITICNL